MTNSIRPLVFASLLLLLLLVCVNLSVSQWIDEDDRKVETDIMLRNTNNRIRPAPKPAFTLVDPKSGHQVQLLPGLLDETLLTKGSFQFGNKLVKFDKLKVSGNVYVNRINGKVLRDTYLLRSSNGRV